ncbi:hypothetical protein [Cellulophaga tyrosinoxydans]|uniref:DoxX protein n=1 Tax=Cellulophaga tyrosinoxydans TaxID=504486 RepID=A0A1W1Y6W6_9FLAO|nr:hypothetical protein [Cellulophaga tyrosinoxydans]SMC31879.1 hypothetical protein SAMN05660703_0077 [Cellulophaga tyrosinoxydans]
MKKIITSGIDKIKCNNLLSISIGLVYLLFGVLKFFTAVSPAEEIAVETIDKLTFGYLSNTTSIFLLAIWETCVGLFLLLNIQKKTILKLALIHMVFTFTPLLIIPEMTFSNSSLAPTLLGQYIFKNIIIIAALATLLKNEKHSSIKVFTNL